MALKWVGKDEVVVRRSDLYKDSKDDLTLTSALATAKMVLLLAPMYETGRMQAINNRHALSVLPALYRAVTGKEWWA